MQLLVLINSDVISIDYNTARDVTVQVYLWEKKLKSLMKLLKNRQYRNSQRISDRRFTCPQTVTHPSSNRTRCRLTSLNKVNALTNHYTKPPRCLQSIYRGTTRMVQLPATAAIEYVAACCRTRTRTRTKIGTITKTVRGAYARSPPSSMPICTV